MWSVEFDPANRLLTLRLVYNVSATQMEALARAHAQALLATAGDPFRVLADLRGLAPLDSEAATVFADLRRSANGFPGFRGRVVVTDSATVAMQQRRTLGDESGHARPELITMDEGEARAFLGRAL